MSRNIGEGPLECVVFEGLECYMGVSLSLSLSFSLFGGYLTKTSKGFSARIKNPCGSAAFGNTCLLAHVYPKIEPRASQNGRARNDGSFW